MSDRILVTGLSGYLGQWALKRNLFQGATVRTITRPGTKPSDIEYPSASLEKAVDEFNPDLVFHFATNYGRDPKTQDQISAVNFDLPYRLLKALQGHSQTVFVNCDTKLPKDVSDYAFFKGAFTELAERMVKPSGGPRLLTLKLEHFYGPHGPQHHFVSFVAEKLRRGEEIPLSPGLQTRDFVHIFDVVDAISVAVKKFKSSPDRSLRVEIGSGEQIPIKSLVEMMKSLSGSQSKLLFGALPLRPNEVMASVADLARLQSWGWQPKVSLELGLKQLFAEQGESQ